MSLLQCKLIAMNIFIRYGIFDLVTRSFLCPSQRLEASMGVNLSSSSNSSNSNSNVTITAICYILSETRMLRNHYFSFFLSTKVCYHLQDLPKLIVGVVCQSVFNPFIEFSHLGVYNS